MKKEYNNIIFLSGWFIMVFYILGSHFTDSVLPIHNLLRSIEIENIGCQFSVFGYWIGMDIITWQNKIFYVLFPVICVCFAFGNKQINVKEYHHWEKRMDIGILGGIGGILPQVIDILVVSCFLPRITPDPATTFYCISPISVMAEIYYTYPILYTLFYLAWNGIIGAIMTLINFEVYEIFSERVMAVVAFSGLLVGSGLLLEYYGQVKYCYYNFLNPGQPVQMGGILNCLLYIVSMVIIWGVIYGWNYVLCKRKRGSKNRR